MVRSYKDRSPLPSSRCSTPTKEKWCMNLIELKWNGFLHPFAFKFERHKKMWEGTEDTHIRPIRNAGKGKVWKERRERWRGRIKSVIKMQFLKRVPGRKDLNVIDVSCARRLICHLEQSQLQWKVTPPPTDLQLRTAKPFTMHWTMAERMKFNREEIYGHPARIFIYLQRDNHRHRINTAGMS